MECQAKTNYPPILNYYTQANNNLAFRKVSFFTKPDNFMKANESNINRNPLSELAIMRKTKK